jgi:hypothetical protein
MDNPGIWNLGEKNPITTAVSDVILTSVADSSGVTQPYVDRLTDMGSATFFVDFEYGSGGTTAILTIDTSLDQGDNWIEIARFDFATADRIAALTVSGAAPADVSSLAALGAEGKRDGFLGDRLRARLTTTGTYAGNTSVKVRAFVRSAGAGTNAADDLAQYVDGLETLLTAMNGYVDSLETLSTAQGTKLDTLHTDIATTLAGLVTTLNGYVDGLETLAAAPLAAGSAVIGKVEAGGVKDSAGDIIFPDDFAQTLTYNADGTVATISFTDTTNTWTQTFTYTTGKVTGISKWVKS